MAEQYRYLCGKLVVLGGSPILDSAREELVAGISSMLGRSPVLSKDCRESPSLVLASDSEARRWVDQRLWQQLDEEGYVLKTVDREGGSTLLLLGKTDQGALYAAFHLLRLMQTGRPIHSLSIVENPKNRLRMINHWDNLDGSVERGYAGGSIFYQKGRITRRLDRIRDYARLLASVGINAIAINNVNVDPEACRLITGSRLPDVARLADVFRYRTASAPFSASILPAPCGSAACPPPIPWTRRCNDGGGNGWKRFIATSPTSAVLW